MHIYNTDGLDSWLRRTAEQRGYTDEKSEQDEEDEDGQTLAEKIYSFNNHDYS